MADTGYTKERDAPHQVAVREFVTEVNSWGVYFARDIQNEGLHKWAPDVAIYRKGRNNPFAFADVKTQYDGRHNISIACDEHNYQIEKSRDDFICLMAFKWRGLWLGADTEWLAEHQIGGDREPTGNGSKTRWRLFGPLSDAPLVSDLLARRVMHEREPA